MRLCLQDQLTEQLTEPGSSPAAAAAAAAAAATPLPLLVELLHIASSITGRNSSSSSSSVLPQVVQVGVAKAWAEDLAAVQKQTGGAGSAGWLLLSLLAGTHHHLADPARLLLLFACGQHLSCAPRLHSCTGRPC